MAGALLEREAEAAALERQLDRAARSRGASAAVEGPAGIGKTSLLAGAVEDAAARGFRVLRGTGSELESSFAFGVAGQLFARVLGEPGALAGAAAQAPAVLGLDPASLPEDENAASHALYWLTANLADDGPLLLAVDDLQWADAASLRFLHFLVRRLEGLPVAVIGATRPPEPGVTDPLLDALLGSVSTTLRLSPLSDEGVGELVQRRLDAPPDPEFVAACAQATGGNAFLLEELLRTLAAEGVAPRATELAAVEDAAPDAVRRRVAAALAATPPAALALAHAVAVLGEAEVPLAAALAGIDPAEAVEAAASLERAALLAPGRALRFAHPLIATSVLASIPAGERSAAHARAARLLSEAGASIDARASHLLFTRPQADAATVAVLREAGAAALGRGAPQEGASYLRRAVLEPPAPADLPPLLLELGIAETRARNFTGAQEALRRGLESDPDDGMRTALVAAVSRASFLTDDFQHALEVLEEESERLTALGRGHEIDGKLFALCLLDPDSRPRVKDRMERYRLEARAGRLADPQMLALLGSSSIAAAEPPEEGVALIRQALAQGLDGVGEDNLYAFGWAMAALDAADLFDEALAHLGAAVAESRRVGAGALTAYLLHYYARALYRTGNVAEVEALGWSTLELMMRTYESEGFLPPPLLDALCERGRPDEADRLIATVPDGGVYEDASQRDAMLELMRGRVAFSAGRPREAFETLVRTGGFFDRLDLFHPTFAPWRSLAALAGHEAGEQAEASRLAAENLQISRRCEAPTAIGRALRVSGVVEGELELLEESCAVLEATPDALEHATSLTALGTALLARGRRDEAREQLRRGLAVAHGAGALTVAEAARAGLVAAGARPRRAAMTGVEALTGSELQVARLAAEGLTNREIAQTLFVTAKTVEQHLSKAYGKLGIAGRAELAENLGVPSP